MVHEKEIIKELDEAARLATQATVLIRRNSKEALQKVELSAKKIAHARILLMEIVKP